MCKNQILKNLTLAMFFIGCTVQLNAGSPIKVLLATGGHDYDRKAFAGMMDSFEGITWRELEHPAVFPAIKPEKWSETDVFLFYDSPNELPEENKADLIKLAGSGKPVIFLHHALCSYWGWNEFPLIIGCQYVRKTYTEDGVTYKESNYKHDVTQPIAVTNKKHFITKGTKDFSIIDETYGSMRIFPGNKILLESKAPEATPPVLWTRVYGNGEIVSFQLGHDIQSFEHPDFKRLLQRAIEYAYKSGRKNIAK